MSGIVVGVTVVVVMVVTGVVVVMVVTGVVVVSMLSCVLFGTKVATKIIVAIIADAPNTKMPLAHLGIGFTIAPNHANIAATHP